MKQLFQKLNVLKVLAFFFDNPYSELHLREIARKLKMSPATVLRCARILESEGLVRRRDEPNGAFLKASMSSEFKALKVAHTLSKLENADIVGFIRQHAKGLGSILLYGSAAKGEDDGNSDYDFLVISAEYDEKMLGIGMGRLGRETNIQVFSISEWKNASQKNRAFYLEAITNSIALWGEKPVID